MTKKLSQNGPGKQNGTRQRSTSPSVRQRRNTPSPISERGPEGEVQANAKTSAALFPHFKILSKRDALLEIYGRLFERYGPQHWWPGDTPFEVMAGAILTQSAAWTNVEKAIANLKTAGRLSPAGIRQMPVNELAALIRPSGYFNAKARKLQAMVQWLGDNFNDDPDRMSPIETWELRKSLLAVHGVGEETADSIVLYAANKPIFVIDAYTRRIMERVGVRPIGASSGATHKHAYGAFQSLFMDNLPADVALFNEYHALFVRHGKETCRKTPLCPQSCLRDICDYGQKQL